MIEQTRKQPYQKPNLEPQNQYVALTGVSLPIGIGLGNDFETFGQDFSESGEQ